MKLCDYFQMTRIINLPERLDRRRDMEKELARVDGRIGEKNVSFFPARRMEQANGFPSPAVRGCYLSHLEVLREAAAAGVEAVLVIEDDLAISPLLPHVTDELLATLQSAPWGIVYFGYTDSDKIHLSTTSKLVPYTETVGCAHFYGIHQRSLHALIAFLEAVMIREPGSPEGGPMHYDGALTTFRAQHPEVLTLLAYPCLGVQRSSRSDIYIRWFERVPALRQASEVLRQVRLWFKNQQQRKAQTLERS